MGYWAARHFNCPVTRCFSNRTHHERGSVWGLRNRL